MPLNQRGRLIGLLLVRSDDASRSWARTKCSTSHRRGSGNVAINQAHLFAQLQQQALTDGLTDCHNRRAFDMQLERDLHLATRMRQPLSLVMLDLDNLKVINDTAGHVVGDLALRMIAEAINAELRGVDTLARYGGDEFAIIQPQADLTGAVVVAERLRLRIEKLAVPGVNSLTASFGVASFPEQASAREMQIVTPTRPFTEPSIQDAIEFARLKER